MARSSAAAFGFGPRYFTEYRNSMILRKICRCDGKADMGDLKSPAIWRTGSSPVSGILVLVAELADALDLGSNVERCAGSSPVGDIRCIFEQNIQHPQQSEQIYFDNTHLSVQHSVVGYGSVTQSVSVLGS